MNFERITFIYTEHGREVNLKYHKSLSHYCNSSGSSNEKVFSLLGMNKKAKQTFARKYLTDYEGYGSWPTSENYCEHSKMILELKDLWLKKFGVGSTVTIDNVNYTPTPTASEITAQMKKSTNIKLVSFGIKSDGTNPSDQINCRQDHNYYDVTSCMNNEVFKRLGFTTDSLKADFAARFLNREHYGRGSWPVDDNMQSQANMIYAMKDLWFKKYKGHAYVTIDGQAVLPTTYFGAAHEVFAEKTKSTAKATVSGGDLEIPLVV